MRTDILAIQPGELKFPFELKKQISCALQLSNPTENYVAFKVKTTSPKKYSVRPNIGMIPPGTTCDVTVTMQAQREAPLDMQCKDKFLVQSVVILDGSQQQEVSQDLFNKESGKEVFESKLRVVYISPPQLPSPVAESADGVLPWSTPNFDNGDRSFFDSGKDTGDLKVELAETRSQVARLTEEKKAALQKTQQLQEEIAMITAKTGGRTNTALQPKLISGFSFLFVLAVGVLGIVVGYLLRS